MKLVLILAGIFLLLGSTLSLKHRVHHLDNMESNADMLSEVEEFDENQA